MDDELRIKWEAEMNRVPPRERKPSERISTKIIHNFAAYEKDYDTVIFTATRWNNGDVSFFTQKFKYDDFNMTSVGYPEKILEIPWSELPDLIEFLQDSSFPDELKKQ